VQPNLDKTNGKIYWSKDNSKISIERSLANEILAAYRVDQSSSAIQKKLELERQADSSR